MLLLSQFVCWMDRQTCEKSQKLILKMTVNKLNVCFTSLINDLMTFCNKFVCFSKIELIKKGTICIVKFSNNNIWNDEWLLCLLCLSCSTMYLTIYINMLYPVDMFNTDSLVLMYEMTGDSEKSIQSKTCTLLSFIPCYHLGYHAYTTW